MDIEEVPRKLTAEETRLTKAEVLCRTTRLGQRVWGSQAWRVAELILHDVAGVAGPDYDYAVEYTLTVADAYNCAHQVPTAVIRALCLMYDRPFVLPKGLWEIEVPKAREDMRHSLDGLRRIQEKYPWVVPNLPTNEHGVPLSLDILQRRPGSNMQANPENVQRLANYHEASYWMHRYWWEELLAMRPGEINRPQLQQLHHTKTNIFERDKVPVKVVPQARILRGAHP